MLKKHDKEFLYELIDIQYLEKPVTSVALYHAGVSPQWTTDLLYKSGMELNEEAESSTPKRDLAGRIQRVVTAKLIAELVSTLENFGSFCYAVKYRHNRSIFSHYALNTKRHNDFFNEIEKQSSSLTDLTNMLGIPTVAELEETLSSEAYFHISRMYTNLAEDIKRATAIYKAKLNEDKDNSPYEFYVAYHTEDEACPPPKNQEDLVKLYNKIKHRFLLFGSEQRVKQFESALSEEDSPNGLKVQFISISITQESIDQIFKTIKLITLSMKSIASILLYLDSEQVEF